MLLQAFGILKTNEAVAPWQRMGAFSGRATAFGVDKSTRREDKAATVEPNRNPPATGN
jgi:hypothetical protein